MGERNDSLVTNPEGSRPSVACCTGDPVPIVRAAVILDEPQMS